MGSAKRKVLAAAVAALLVAAWAVASDDGGPSPAAVERARAAADALGSELMRTLLREMADGGPIGAVKVCSEKAQAIAAAHSTDGLTVRRVSLKARNPKDVPDEYERQILEKLEAGLRAGEDLPAESAAEVTEDGSRRLRYMRPLMIKKPCLRCHGDPETIDADVRRLIAEHYPDDQAVGYREGDLRGAVSVVVELGEGTPE